ncbi:MAG: response regulator [Candidatus Margulisbacteria bacterium]|nr:response regulator [Candidatus Margulisiibacteriota bacterium]
MKKKILLIEDNAAAGAKIREILADYEVSVITDAGAAGQHQPDLVIIDADIKAAKSLDLLQQVRWQLPRINVIMLSASNDIPLAVAATKSGAADFLKKPVPAQALLAAVEKQLNQAGQPLAGEQLAGWLLGESRPLKKMYADLRSAAFTAAKNLVVLGGVGVEVAAVVKYFHEAGPRRKQKLKTIDLSEFNKSGLENHFWGAVKEATAASVALEEKCGTLFIDKLDAVNDVFRASIVQYFRGRKERSGADVISVLGLIDKRFFPPELAGDYSWIEVPLLRERKEDLFILLSHSLKQAAAKYDKKVKGWSADALDFLANYDWPGNYQELACLVDQAVLAADSELVELKDLALDANSFLRGGTRQPEGSESELYNLLLAKKNGDVSAVARFLDIPRTALADRLEDLAD